MTKSNLKRDFFWNTVGVLAQNAISPILLIVVTRINGIYDSGVFSFAFSVSVIFLALGMWGGRTFQVSDTKNQFSSLNYINVRIVLSTVMLVGAIIFCTMNNYDLFKSSMIIGLVVVKVFETISDALYGTMQVGKKLYLSGRSLLLKAILGLILFVVIDIATQNILWATAGLVFANFIVVLVYDLRKVLKIDNRVFSSKKSTLNMILRDSAQVMRVTFPVFAITFMAMFTLNIPRYFVDMYHSSEIGYFGILAMPITLVTLAVSFLLQPKMLDLAIAYNNGRGKVLRSDIRFILIVTTLISIAIILITYVIGVPTLGFIFGLDFTQYKLELMIVVLGAVFNAYVAIFMNIIIISRRFKVPFLIYVFSNLILIVLCMIYVLQYGLLAGLVLYMIINLIQLVLLGVFCLRLVRNIHEEA